MFTILSILICTYFPIFDILAEILLCCTGYLEVDVSHLIFSYTSAEEEVIITQYVGVKKQVKLRCCILDFPELVMSQVSSSR